MWQDSSEGNRGSNEGIKFFVTADSELEVARGYPLNFEVFGRILCKSVHGTGEERTGTAYTSEFKNFCGEILEDCGHVYGSFGTDTHLVLGVVLQETLDTTAWELCGIQSQCIVHSATS